ncbi:hypothetical protein S58_47570 [Bradyrhizobium oligotrophicum S58]|uniref:Uncharacterized protein n=1 Tax=Bradyrhizobium oligotrophicum S58 TaxID=1245469 RepID=M4ZBA7_9BRAD|nr:hypothetical protein S58_47570 [Bradyrhizobium oligotrophicum S58]
MGEIDHADDAIDHRITDGDQAVDRAQDEAVDELLRKIIHGLPIVRLPRVRLPIVVRNAAGACGTSTHLIREAEQLCTEGDARRNT